MKRGFLNSNPRSRPNNRRSGEASASSAGTSSDRALSQDIQIVELDLHDVNPNAPTKLQKCNFGVVQLPLHWSSASVHPKALIISTIPSTVPGDPSTTCCVLYARTKLRLSTLPPSLPCAPRDSMNLLSRPYEIRSVGPKKLGVFATRPLKIGDLILVEMPLMVLPIHTDLSGVKCPDVMREWAKACREKNTSYMVPVDAMLNLAFTLGNMRKEHKDAYLALDRSFWDGIVGAGSELSSIWSMNGFEISGLDLGEDGDKYAAVLKVSSRINHSCRPNCAHSFSPDSFTLEFRATREISAGEEIVYSACDPCTPTSMRQQMLKDLHEFTCTCLSCANNPDPVNDALRVSFPSRLNALSKAWHEVWNPDRIFDMNFDMYMEALKVYEASSCLVRDMEQVGLDGYALYPRAMKICYDSCRLLRTKAKSRKGLEAEEKRWEKEVSRIEDKSILCSFASDGSYVTRKRRERG